MRAEISSKEREEEQEMEKVVTQTKDKKEEQDPEQQIQVGCNVTFSLVESKIGFLFPVDVVDHHVFAHCHYGFVI